MTRKELIYRRLKDTRESRRQGRPGPSIVDQGWKFGDAVESALSSVGITKDFVSSWLGGCGGCSDRQEKLNQLGSWAKRVVSGKVEKAKEYLEAIIGAPVQQVTQPVQQSPKESTMEWVYGVTTISSRLHDYLPKTLKSLSAAGFDKPRLFIDDTTDAYDHAVKFQVEVTCRHPKINIHGNWYLGMQELYIRNPTAQRYAMFQDDLVACKNLRGYLEHVRLEKSYLNLFTFRDNEDVIKGKPYGRFYDASLVSKSNNQWQTGRGALALVFNNEGVRSLLASEHMVSRPHEPRESYPRRIDGGIVTAMNKAGFRELIHNPSLVQHTGEESTIGSRKGRVALSFPGEDFDCLEFLKLNKDNLANLTTEANANGSVTANYADLDREIQALEKAIADDKERLRTATDSALIRKTRAYIRDYSNRLNALRKERV